MNNINIFNDDILKFDFEKKNYDLLIINDPLKDKDLRQKAECNIHVKGRDLFAECAHADLYAAVDQLADKLDRQVLKHKDKTQDHHHQASKRMAVG